METSPHPRNKDFAWQDHPGPYRRLTRDQVRQYDEEGFLVLEDAFDADLIADVIEAIDPLEQKMTDFLRTQKDGKLFIARAEEITFTSGIAGRNAKLREFVGHPVFRDLVWDLIGPDVRLYWDQSVYKKPGTADPFPWHQDNGYNFVEPQNYLTCWVALTDATIEHGCPWVIPKIHRGGTLDHRSSDLGWVCLEDPDDPMAAPVRAGSIVIFSSLTPHATGPNTTDEVRKSYIVQFAPDGAAMFPRDVDAPDGIPCTHPDRNFWVLRDGQPPKT